MDDKRSASQHRMALALAAVLAVLSSLSLLSAPASAECGGCPTGLAENARHSGDAKGVQRGRVLSALLNRQTEHNQLDLRFDTYLMTVHGAWRYALTTGELPRSLDEMKGYIFFEPTCKFTTWEVDGHWLRFDAQVLDMEPRVLDAKIPKPGTQAWQEEEERHRRAEFEAFHRRPVDPRVADVSAQDVLEGRFSNYFRYRLEAFARNDTEFLQLYWSWQLVGFLHAALEDVRSATGRYPESAEGLLGFLPPRNEEAWVAPMTGERVDFADDPSEGIVYRSLHGGRGFELLVPLFGAGADHALRGNKHRFRPREGYEPGKYFRRAKGTDLDTPLVYGV